MKKYVSEFVALAGVAALAMASLLQADMIQNPQRFILTSARLSQTPSGEGMKRPDGPSALLDGYRRDGNRTSWMPYPLGKPNQNYFWLELGISHFPAAHGYEARLPDRIRIRNGACPGDRLPKEFGKTLPVRLGSVKMDLYYRGLNDPDQDFGYLPTTLQDTYVVDLPADSDSLDVMLNLPAPPASDRYPEGMHMVLLKLTILSVVPLEKSGEMSDPPIQNQSNIGQTLAICEIQYGDRAINSGKAEDFFVFW
ncbi:MAG: hypothetical protein KDK33_05830 [Leptospiraceae bacterium]|nr:hypothetical protein [Leptospiraceae bacterium]